MVIKDKLLLSYLAGFFDGEGNVSIAQNGKKRIGRPSYHILWTGLANTNPIVAHILYSIFGGTLYLEHRKNKKHKSVWRWKVTGNKAVEFLECILPYTKQKTEQIKIGLQFRKLIRNSKNPRRLSYQEINERLLLRDKIMELNKRGQ